MFYKVKVKDHIRVPPNLFHLAPEKALVERIRKKYSGYSSQELGIVVSVLDLEEVGDGAVIAGDGASYYEVTFELATFKPELNEVVLGRVRDVAEFGAFMNIGPIDGMIHISQTMDDFVSFSKDKTLAGKESKRVLRPGDVCRARLIAVSFKDPLNPKLGLTMRQQGLGRLDWIEEDNAGDDSKKGAKKETKK